MNNLKNVGVTVVVAVIVTTGLYLFLQGEQDGGTPIPQEILGAVPGNEINGNYFIVGGVEQAFVKQNWIASTTRVCIIKNPFPNASSTLMSFTARNTNKTVAGVNSFSLSTTTHSNGYGATTTNTIFKDWAIPTLSQTSIDATQSGVLPVILAGVEHLKVTRNATSTAGTDNYQGICQATFQKL